MSALIFGLPRSGKSTLAVTCPAPRLYLDAEGGVDFLPILPKFWDPKTEAPPEPDGTWDTAVVTVTDWDLVLTVYQWLNSGQHHFESVVMDSVSEMQQKLIEKMAGRMQPSQQQWGEVLRNFTGLLRDFRDLKLHPTKPIRMLSLVAMAKTGDGGKLVPWFQGQSSIMIPYFFDINGAMLAIPVTTENGAVTVTHRLQIGPHQFYETGQRVGGRLPSWIDDPNLSTMLSTVFPEPAATAPPASTSEPTA